MKNIMSRKPILNAVLGMLVSIGPIAAANAVSPLGFEIPAPGTAGPLIASTTNVSAARKGVSPLGWEIPASEPRGAQGPLRLDTAEVAPYGWAPNYHLGGIGDSNTN